MNSGYHMLCISFVLLSCVTYEKSDASFLVDEFPFNISSAQENNDISEMDPVVEAHTIVKPSVSSRPEVSSETQVERANQDSLQNPDVHTFQNSLVIYNYMKHYMYSIYTSPQRVTLVRLEEGEELTGNLVAGDTANWIIATELDHKSTVIYIKPVRADITTNLIISTTKRTYYLILSSLNDTYMVSVEWRYPLQAMQMQERRKTILDTKVDIDQLYFNYRIISVRNAPSWKPSKVFDDGTRTFIQFFDKAVITEYPALFMIVNGRKKVLVNYRVIENFYVVDGILYNAELRLGNKRKQRVKIVRVDHEKN